jgi:hypothetical protein
VRHPVAPEARPVRRASAGRAPLQAPEWVSYHFFYHQPGDRLLLRLVLPLVRDLRRRGRISRFFFIRHGEGGPHIRLRLLCAPRHRPQVDACLCRRAERFFARWPSRPLDGDAEARRQTWCCLVSDGRDGAAHPDNSVAEIPFEPEVERYGGVDLLDGSLEYFYWSSACVLHLAARHRGMDKPRLLSLGLRLLWRQALGFAAGREDLARLAAYMAGRRQGDPLVERADQEFATRGDSYTRLLREEIEILRDGGALAESPGFLLAAAARHLREAIRGADGEARWRILGSQLHMTANRLGLLKLEELYLGRLLWRALHDVSPDARIWRVLDPLLKAPILLERDALESLVSAALAPQRKEI